jgi:hypothetical protein
MEPHHRQRPDLQRRYAPQDLDLTPHVLGVGAPSQPLRLDHLARQRLPGGRVLTRPRHPELATPQLRTQLLAININTVSARCLARRGHLFLGIILASRFGAAGTGRRSTRTFTTTPALPLEKLVPTKPRPTSMFAAVVRLSMEEQARARASAVRP